jgi:hypothetical protein
MPFIQVTKRMAERRAGRRRTRQQFEIESLTGGLQRGTASAAAQFTEEQNKIQQSYQTQLADYGERLKQFEAQTEGFKGQFDAYNAAVDRFNTVSFLPLDLILFFHQIKCAIGIFLILIRRLGKPWLVFLV